MMAGFRGLSKTARKAVLRTARQAVKSGGEPPAGGRPAFGSGMSNADWERFEKNTQSALDMAALDWVSVSSSNVAMGAYQPDFRRLFIRFNSGSVYRYEDIPKQMWDDFLSAPSKGQWVYRTLRANGTDSYYAYSKVA
jgi:hypothetical protein